MLAKAISGFHAIIGRGFADHFYLFIKVTSVHKAMAVFKQEMEKIAIETKSYEIPFFPKFGISFLKPDSDINGNKIQGLIGQASFAKSTIKDNLLTQYSIYNSRLVDKINEERYIESHMEQALENHEFFVMYQPKISLNNDKIVGAEALVRWNSAQFGLLTPDKFIPLFERNGFITKLDYYVYEEVFKFIQTRITKGEEIVPISVNMSRNHNRPEKFMHDFMEIFNRYSISPSLIQLEILERSVMDNETLQDITEKLHKEGFTVAMDDFGSGESSLNMLTKIPVDVLKFDREFLNSSTDSEGRIDKKSEKFINILINLSKNLDKQTVFEGVETQAQRDFLRSIECDQAQGFFYSRPLSEQDFIQFIKLHS
jgi:EAL domain-containing protein (putative c-di-GMP-specific phosphodiesterase class I)